MRALKVQAKTLLILFLISKFLGFFTAVTSKTVEIVNPGAKDLSGEIYAPEKNFCLPSVPLKITLLQLIQIFYTSLGESFLKCYSEYALTSGIAISVSTNPTTKILSKIADTHKKLVSC